MEDAYIIQGGKKLKGEVMLSGAKNVALKTIIAALLFDTKVTLENIPRINDVFELLHLIKALGVKAEFIDKNKLEIDPRDLNQYKVDLLHASKTRVSFMLFAPLLYRFQKAHAGQPGGDVFIPNPGGCRLGARPIDRIVNAMKALGVAVKYNHESGYYEAHLTRRPKGTYRFEKTTHTGTELLIMLSVFCQNTVIIENAALEPEIDDLIEFLNSGGAKIERQGIKIVVKGVEKLVQKNPYSIISDRNEAVTYAVLALITGGDITVKGVKEEFLAIFLEKLREANAGVEVGTDSIRFYHKGEIKPVSIETSVEPGFMTDWQPNWAVLMTQSVGESTIHERVFENRFAYVEELKKLGADIEFIDVNIQNPRTFYEFNWDDTMEYKQMIKIHGPVALHNGALTISDLRAGATLAIAALSAQGETIVNGVSILERGYENFVEKVQKLGGNIKKV